MLETWIPAVNYIVGAGTVGVAGALLRWGIKVDRALTTQNVINEQIVERLTEHARLMQTIVASNGQAQYARRRK